MVKTIFAAMLLMAYCGSAMAANRCTIDGKTVYQDAPCPGTLGTVGDDIKAREAARKAATAQKATAPAMPDRSDAIDRMTTYTTILGRGIACGTPGTEDASRRLGTWMDAQGLNGYAMVAATSIRTSAEQQRAGKSPDTCAKVREVFKTITWP